MRSEGFSFNSGGLGVEPYYIVRDPVSAFATVVNQGKILLLYDLFYILQILLGVTPVT